MPATSIKRKKPNHRRLHGWPAMFQHRFGISHIHVGHRRYAAMEGGGRAMQEQLPSATQEQLPRTRRSQRNQHKILCALCVLCGEKNLNGILFM